jgi:hypothetical protein
MTRQDEPIRPMTLGNMHQNGVRGLDVTCSACGYHTEVNVDAWMMTSPCHHSGPGCGVASAATSAPMPDRTGTNEATGCLERGDDKDDSLPPSRPGTPSATFQAVPLFWLNYRHPRGRFAGAVVVESSSLVSARMAATVYGLNDRLEFASGHELDLESALKVPTDTLGRLLDDRELRKLSRMLLGPKKPPAPSLWRPKGPRRRAWFRGHPVGGAAHLFREPR